MSIYKTILKIIFNFSIKKIYLIILINFCMICFNPAYYKQNEFIVCYLLFLFLGLDTIYSILDTVSGVKFSEVVRAEEEI